MEQGDEVVLAKAPEWRGRVAGRRGRSVDVEFTGGGTGTFPEDDLVQVQDKSWPPPTMETKVPTVGTK